MSISVYGRPTVIIGSGSDDSAVELLNGTVSRMSSPLVTVVKPYAFASCNNLSYISFPNCSRIGSYAFEYCENLRSVYIPNCSDIGYCAFEGCHSLPEIQADGTLIQTSAFTACGLSRAILPGCTAIPDYAFRFCYSLSSLVVGNVSTIGSQAFYGCALSEVNFPYCESVSTAAFINCSQLVSAYLPRVSTLNNGIFGGCSSLHDTDFYACGTIASSAVFSGCRSLESLVFPNLTSFGYYASSVFYGCSRLSAVYFYAASVISLGYYARTYMSTNFAGTPIANSTYLGYYGSIYVPAVVLSAYQAASGWSYYSARFAPLPSEYDRMYVYPYEFYSNQTITELPVDKSDAVEVFKLAGAYCSNLTTINLPSCKGIGQQAFFSCGNLVSASLPECETVGERAFYNCVNLVNTYMPKCLSIDNSAFMYAQLSEINIPLCEVVRSSAFMGCLGLQKAVFSNCKSIFGEVFYGCKSLQSLYLLGSEVISTFYQSALYMTPMSNSTFLGYYGSIYVRASLLTAYQQTSGLSYYASRIVGLTDEQIASL